MKMPDRGVSVLINYVMVLGIVALLSTGLFISTNDLVEGQHERAIRTQLDVVGNHVASDLETVGRLAESVEGNGSVRLTSELPDRVAGSEYWVNITRIDDTRYRITLTTHDPKVSVQVVARSQTPISSTTVKGGSIAFECGDGGCADEPVEVTDD